MKRILLIIAILLFGTCSALACTCIEDFSTKDALAALKQSSAVFSGKLVSAEFKKGFSNRLTERNLVAGGKKDDYEVWILTFEVENYWKGGKAAIITLITDKTRAPNGIETSSTCDYYFELGERYLVYALRDKGDLRTHSCTKTQKLSQSEKDLKRLGKGKKPKNATTG